MSAPSYNITASFRRPMPTIPTASSFPTDPAALLQTPPGLLDDLDPLAEYRAEFHLPRAEDGSPLLYFVGNSLGLQPRSARALVEEEMDAWARLGVEGHFKKEHPWMSYHEALSEQMAAVVGGLPDEVVIMNSLTVNLHLMLVSFFRPTASRFKIVMEAQAFPSDRYAVVSQLEHHGLDPAEALVMLPPRPGEVTLRTEDIVAYLDREGASVAVVLLGGVNYYTGQAFDLQKITEAAHAKGCIAGFDCAHAAGNLALQLHDWDVDFAVWCTYKYLNAGPGALAGCFIHQRHARRSDLPRFAGWWGHDKATRFLMPDTFTPISSAEGWQLSNPPILSLAPLRASLALFAAAGMPALRNKSKHLTGYLSALIEDRAGEAVEILTPSEPDQRGAQLSLRVRRDARRVFEHLSKEGVLCDWREPDAIRVAPAPLYNYFTEVYRFVEILQAAL